MLTRREAAAEINDRPHNNLLRRLDRADFALIEPHLYLPAYTRIVVKFGGPLVRLPIVKLDAAKTRSASLRNVFARYADCMLAQTFQSTACNAIHSIEQRTAKWIISAMERTDGSDAVPLTHEQLAMLLGVGRSYASRVIQTFKAEGIVE